MEREGGHLSPTATATEMAGMPTPSAVMTTRDTQQRVSKATTNMADRTPSGAALYRSQEHHESKG
jgi:hypothetical protein